MLLSIVIATYQAGEALEKTLRSLLILPSDEVEIRIADGGSTDVITLEIIQRFKPYLAEYISEPDKGVYDAWNKLIPRCKGTFIAFFGSGDTIEPTYFSECKTQLLKSNIGIEYLACRVNQQLPNGKKIREKGNPWYWKDMKRNMSIAHVGSWHAKSAFEEHGLFDTSYKICGDYAWFLQAGSTLKTCFIETPLVNMQIGGMSDHNPLVFAETRRARQEILHKNLFNLWYYDQLYRLRKQLRKWLL